MQEQGNKDGKVDLALDHGVASVTFDRPAARNPMTWAIYGQLRAICEQGVQYERQIDATKQLLAGLPMPMVATQQVSKEGSTACCGTGCPTART